MEINYRKISDNFYSGQSNISHRFNIYTSIMMKRAQNVNYYASASEGRGDDGVDDLLNGT